MEVDLELSIAPSKTSLFDTFTMSGEQHSDLERFYASRDPEDRGDEWVEDDDEDADYEYFVDADEIDEEGMEGTGEDDEEDDVYLDDEGEDEEDMGEATIVVDPSVPNLVQGGDDESGTTFLNLAALLNQSGGNADARTSLLARLLAGPAAGTRRSAGLLRQLASGGAAPVNEEERRRAAEERRRAASWWEPQTEPHPRGIELLKSGEFGKVGEWRVPGRRAPPRVVQPRRRGFVPPAAQVC